MANTLRHCPRLLSPSESLLYALLPQSIPRRPLSSHRQQIRTFKNKRELPADFSLSRILEAERNDAAAVTLHPALRTHILNDAITTPYVQQVQPPDPSIPNSKRTLSNPKPLHRLLATLNLNTHAVHHLGAGPSPDTSVVEVVSLASLLQAAQAREDSLRETAKERARANKTKQLELNWAISGNDLEMKLRQMEKFLDKGAKVEVLLANKKRQRKADEDEAHATLEAVRHRVKLLGASEAKALEGRVGAQATLVVAPRPRGVPKPVVGEDGVVEDVEREGAGESGGHDEVKRAETV
jgi:hypothetical protein